MKLGMFGLGKMGANMALRLMRGGHKVVGWSRSQGTVDEAKEAGVEPATNNLDEALSMLEPPRTLWLMVPAGYPVDDMIDRLMPLTDEGDIIIDGGNSNYKDTVRRNEELSEKGYRFMDVGTSGGIWGLAEGYSMMIGGEEDAVERLRPLFETLAPAPDRAWGHMGPTGSGHFVKMVHNGIEYGMMQAYGEGFEILEKSRFDYDLGKLAHLWNHGSVVRSWLLELAASAFAKDAHLTGIRGYVQDSGEGRWTVQEAIDLDVPAPVLTLSLQARFVSRQEESFSAKVAAALRNEFGGHAVKKAE